MKVTDKKAARLFLDRKEGRVSSNTRVFSRDDGGEVTYVLELFGNEIAWHYEDGMIQVRVTQHSYTTHMRLNALSFLLGSSFQAYTEKRVGYVVHNGETFEAQPKEVHCLRSLALGVC